MAQFIGSPNYTTGREGTTIDRVLIHWMDGTLGATDSVFQDTGRQTSAHYGIEDNNVHQYVNEGDTAYHAGVWDMNLRSIGIEHSAGPDRNASPATMETSAHLIADVCSRHGIPIDRAHIIKHSQVIPTQCPGSVDIDWLVNRAKQIAGGEDMAEKISLEAGRILYATELGYDGIRQDPKLQALRGDLDAEIKAKLVGKDLTIALLRDLNNSPEAEAARTTANGKENEIEAFRMLDMKPDEFKQKVDKIKEILAQ